jgi:AraC-like DNA-binding protein/quercetin dioxygenase-like cupin family protein
MRLDRMGINKHDLVKMKKKPEVLTIRGHFPDPEFPLSLFWLPSHGSRRIHSHEFEELVVVIGGRGRHRTGGGEWQIRTGDVFVVPRGERHAYAKTERLELCNVLFQPERLPLDWASLDAAPGYRALFAMEPRWRGGAQGSSRLRLDADALAETVVLLKRLQRELAEDQPGRQMVSVGLFLQLVGLLCRAYGKHPHREGRRLLGLERAMNRLTSLQGPAPSLLELAALAGMSVSTFQRAWHRYAGRTPNDYLLELRLDRARVLLETTMLTVSEVSARVGFEDSNYFSRRFRIAYGNSPRRWRTTLVDNNLVESLSHAIQTSMMRSI